MTPSSAEHWLDRLSAPRTRRQVLKAALAGASLTLPLNLVRSTPAHAAGPSDCQVGCVYTANRKFQAARADCVNGYLSHTATALLLFSPVLLLSREVGKTACLDTAILANKARGYDCYQPNCPGFDPKGAYGPCEHAPKDSHCCACPNNPIGYIPCYAPCDDVDHSCCR